MEKEISKSRLIAALLDSLFVGVISGIIAGIIAVISIIFTEDLFSMDTISFVNDLTIVSASVSVILTFLWFTIIPLLNKNRATLGKMIMGLKVIREDDKTPGFSSMIIRNIRLYFQAASLIFSILALIPAINSAILVFSIIVSILNYVMYITVIVQITKSPNSVFYDKWAKTRVESKLYDPNLKNYQTIEEIKDWADVKGFEKTKKVEVEYKDPEEKDDVTDKNYWD